MSMLLKLSKFFSMLALKCNQKSLYFELEHYIKNKQSYLKPISAWMRGIGKTYTLVKLARKYKCPIVVGRSALKLYVLGLAGKKPIQVFAVNEDLRGYPKYDLVLCDEIMDDETLEKVVKPMANIVVGYRYVGPITRLS